MTNSRIEQIQNNFESKINIKIESNSRGYNTSVHVYQGVTQKEMDETISKSIYAHRQLQCLLSAVEKGVEVKRDD